MRYDDAWPVFRLRVRTPRLTLRPADPDLALTLAGLAAEGIHEPGEMPFNVPWTDAPPDELRRETLRHYFGRWSTNEPSSWHWPLAVLEGDVVVGVQSMLADDFAVLRQFATGSWVGRRFQGRGVGREMRAAVLHLGFAGLGADRALTGAFADNPASLAVTRALGYEPNGAKWVVRRGRAVEQPQFVLTRERWATTRRTDIAIEGLDDEVAAALGARPG